MAFSLRKWEFGVCETNLLMTRSFPDAQNEHWILVKAINNETVNEIIIQAT